MSYLYSQLRDALGGKSFYAGQVSKDWSPNEVRSIIIMRDFILIVDFLKMPKLVKLDVEEVGQDLENPNRSGFLNNLLKNRQLSCLEEIYVDSAFIPYKNVVDLEEFVQSVYNSASRLRYAGYVSGFSQENLLGAYQKVRLESVFDFTLAKGIGGFKYIDTENKEWYKHYNLRPQYYTLDKERGLLHLYFKKCEKYIGDQIAAEAGAEKELTEAERIGALIKKDLEDYTHLERLAMLAKFLKKGGNREDSMVKDAIGRLIDRKKKIHGLTGEKIRKAMKVCNIPLTENAKALVSAFYSKMTEEGSDVEIDFERFEGQESGFLELGSGLVGLYADIENELEYAKTWKEGKVLFRSATADVCCLKPAYASIFDGDPYKLAGVTDSDIVDAYTRFLFAFVGWTPENFLKMYARKR